ncbi:MAG: hypothetical protein KA767_01530 [Saprospiraceae bacterium]|nr:hypothetical protein [Saprospiraceae bacterium]
MEFIIKLFLWIALGIFSRTLISQSKVIGNVVDEKNNPIEFVNIILYSPDGKEIIKYSTTDILGKFELEIFCDTCATFLLSANHLSYEPFTKVLRLPENNLTLVMSNRMQMLPEVTVENEPIYRKGDTLIFSVNHFRQVSDLNIEDILSRIPGISVESNGKIKYNGLDISKFYIEGLDLLEGRYKIATRNLNIDAIKEIEVIEHHQAIKALDSLVIPENAAINLKLKAKIAFTGNFNLGAGYEPLNGIASSDIFGFQKKQQFNLIGSYNSLGYTKVDLFENLYSQSSIISVMPLSVDAPFYPLIDTKFYLDNEEKLIGYNFLRKISESIQVKFRAFLSKDKIEKFGTSTTQYSDPNYTFIFNKTLNVIELPSRIYQSGIIEKNSTRWFLKAEISGELIKEDAEANNLINEQNVKELFSESTKILDSKVSSIIRVGNRAFKINSDISYKTGLNFLNISPSSFRILNEEDQKFETTRQEYSKNRFASNTYSNLYYRKGLFFANSRFGQNFISTDLITDLFEIDVNNQKKLLGNKYSNDVVNKEIHYYIHNDFQIDKEKFKLRFYFPVEFISLKNVDKISGNQSTFNILSLESKIFFDRKNLHYLYGFNYDYSTGIKSFDLYYDGYILNAYQSISSSNININRVNEHKLSSFLKLPGKRGGLSAYVSTTIGIRSSNLISENYFSEVGLSGTLSKGKNNSKFLDLTTQSNIALLKSKLGIELRVGALFNKNDIIINGLQNSIFTSKLHLDSKLSILFPNTVLSYISKNIMLKGQLNNTIYQFANGISYFQKIHKNGSIKAELNSYYSIFTNKNQVNTLGSISYKYKLIKHKIELEVIGNNLSNNKYFTNLSQEVFFQSTSNYLLRERQFTISMKKLF